MTLFLTRQRAITEGVAAMISNKRAADCRVDIRRERNADGSVDYGFAVTLLDAERRPVVTL